MTLIEKICFAAGKLQPNEQQQVLDFIAVLKQREQMRLDADMDAIISENLLAWKELAK